MKKQILFINSKMKAKFPEIKIEAVKLIGKLKGSNKKIELLMDKKTFDEWRKLIK